LFKRLKEVAEGRVDLLTVRSTEVSLIRTPLPTLYLVINDEMEVLTNTRERRAHYKTASPRLRKQVKKWETSAISTIKVASEEHPLEVVTGDIALILIIEGRKYLVSFFRDIDPIGWLVAGGCPRSRREFFDVKALALREGSEEILISDTNGRIYDLFPVNESLETNIQDWKLEKKKIIQLPAREVRPAEGHAQRLIVNFNDQETKIEDVNVTVDYEFASVAATWYFEAELPIKLNELRVFDGERLPDKTLINRPVQLTDKEGYQIAIFSRGLNILSGKAGKPKWISEGTGKRAVIP
jgi:hypothetical protein